MRLKQKGFFFLLILGFWLAGKGSYGAVYKARDIRTSELVAIKVISLSEGVRMIFLFVFDIHGIGWMNHYGMNLLAFFFVCRKKGMKKFVVKSRCCNNVVIQMLCGTLGATKGKNIFGLVH